MSEVEICDGVYASSEGFRIAPGEMLRDTIVAGPFPPENPSWGEVHRPGERWLVDFLLDPVSVEHQVAQ